MLVEIYNSDLSFLVSQSRFLIIKITSKDVILDSKSPEKSAGVSLDARSAGHSLPVGPDGTRGHRLRGKTPLPAKTISFQAPILNSLRISLGQGQSISLYALLSSCSGVLSMARPQPPRPQPSTLLSKFFPWLWQRISTACAQEMERDS